MRKGKFNNRFPSPNSLDSEILCGKSISSLGSYFSLSEQLERGIIVQVKSDPDDSNNDVIDNVSQI